jgi:uncharacterized protein (TIGR03437 family)
MSLARPVLFKFCLRLAALVVAVVFVAYLVAVATHAQSTDTHEFQPNTSRALASRAEASQDSAAKSRPDGYAPRRLKQTLPSRPVVPDEGATARDVANNSRRVARSARWRESAGAQRLSPTSKFSLPPESSSARSSDPKLTPALITRRIPSGTSLSYVLHTSQLSTISSAGSVEQFYDSDVDLVADSRTTFDAAGGAFDIAVGRSGTRYEVFSAIDDRGTQTPSDDLTKGVLVVGRDANADFVRDSSATYDLRRDFDLPSAGAIVAGTSRAGREFVVVSSSGYFNAADPHDPANEPTAGVVLLVRDSSALGFDTFRSRSLITVGSREINNANALALLPNNDLLIADFDSDELRIVRDTDADGIPDKLDPVPYYSFRFSNDAPVEVAANSRGVVFTHSVGNSTVMLALYDTNNDGRADTDEVCVEGLSIDNNLILHGLTVDREGTVYVVEDAAGASDLVSDGGNGGTPLIDAFPDPALNGFLRDGALYVTADNPTSQALTGLAFGEDTSLAPVARLALTNSASLQGAATRDGLGTINGAGLTFGRTGESASDAASKGVRVYVEGRSASVLSFNDSRVNIHVPDAVGVGIRSVVVTVDGYVVAAEDVTVANANPGLFTFNGSGTGEAIALLVSGMRYTRAPFPAKFNGDPSVIALFGTGWRNSLPVAVQIGGRAAVVEASVKTDFPGLDQLNVRLPDGVTGVVPVVVTTASGAQSRGGVTITIN